MPKKSLYYISYTSLPFAKLGTNIILNKTLSNPLYFIEEYFDMRDIKTTAIPGFIIKINVSTDIAFTKTVSHATGQVLWSPKSEFMACQIMTISEYGGIPMFHCRWKTSKFICDLEKWN